MRAQVYSVPGQTEGRSKASLEWKNIDLSYKLSYILSLTCGCNVSCYKSVKDINVNVSSFFLCTATPSLPAKCFPLAYDLTVQSIPIELVMGTFLCYVSDIIPYWTKVQKQLFSSFVKIFFSEKSVQSSKATVHKYFEICVLKKRRNSFISAETLTCL